MSKDSYRHWPWMVTVIRLHVKEIKEVIWTTAVCSFRSQTVYFCSTVYFFSTMYCKVWDLRLQIAVVMLPLYFPLLTTCWWLCLVAETCSCLLTSMNMCCVVGSFLVCCNTGTQLEWIDKELFNSFVRIRLIGLR